MRAYACLLAIVIVLATAFLAGCGTGIGNPSAEPSSANLTENQTNQPGKTGGQEVGTMKITSNMFKEGEKIPERYTCKGIDVNPQLAWEDVPSGTKSFALIVDDPDAPVGLWTHWLVKNIAPDRRMIEEQSIPGIEVINSAGKKNYHGPCPPSGTHRYYFKLYALDVARIEAITKADFYREVEQHKIAVGQLMGRYSKS